MAAAATLMVLISAGDGKRAAPLTIDVFARRYSWSFGFPSKGRAFSAQELHVPVGQPLRFRMYSEDDDHAFWVPEWRTKVDVPAGASTIRVLTPRRPGTFQLICASFCGIGHAYMRAAVVVESQREFMEWVAGLDRQEPPRILELGRLDRELQSIHKANS